MFTGHNIWNISLHCAVWVGLLILLYFGMLSCICIVQLKLLMVLKRSIVWSEVDYSCCVSDTPPPSSSSPSLLSTFAAAGWGWVYPIRRYEFVQSRKSRHDTISPPPSQLMGYLLPPRPPNPVSSGRSHLQCKTISAHVKRQFLQSIDHKLLLENGIILTKGYSLSSRGPGGNPLLF